MFACRYPFDNKKYEIKIVRPKGDFAHENFPESRYAVDFDLPFGAPVLAVSKGFVFSERCDSDVHFSTKEVGHLSMDEKIELANKYTNYVSISHNGIYTEYCHLAAGKVVSKNQSVNEGEVIGYVGLSGITDSEHLHFNAFEINNLSVRSVPVKFIE